VAINKKNLLGKNPIDVGIKDAVHVAIVSLVAGTALPCGCRIKLNCDNQAIPARDGDKDSFGVVSPWSGRIARGERFWALMDPDSVAAVEHTWDCDIDFSVKPKLVEENGYIADVAKKCGVTYEQMMQACKTFIDTERPANYPGTLSEETVEEETDSDDLYTLWSEWSEETGYEFDNMGSECCPEYEYPDRLPFEWV